MQTCLCPVTKLGTASFKLTAFLRIERAHDMETGEVFEVFEAHGRG